MYWWSEEIADFRRECVRRRRWYTRLRRRAVIDEDTVAELYGLYRDAKRELQLAIKRAKALAWEKLLGDLDRNLWGRPYRIILNKLRSGGSPVTEVLDPRFLRDVNTLFTLGGLPLGGNVLAGPIE